MASCVCYFVGVSIKNLWTETLKCPGFKLVWSSIKKTTINKYYKMPIVSWGSSLFVGMGVTSKFSRQLTSPPNLDLHASLNGVGRTLDTFVSDPKIEVRLDISVLFFQQRGEFVDLYFCKTDCVATWYFCSSNFSCFVSSFLLSFIFGLVMLCAVKLRSWKLCVGATQESTLRIQHYPHSVGNSLANMVNL